MTYQGCACYSDLDADTRVPSAVSLRQPTAITLPNIIVHNRLEQSVSVDRLQV